MVLARAGYLSSPRIGGWQWTSQGEVTASIGMTGGRDAITLEYRVRSGGGDWQSVHQRVPIQWTRRRLGGERPWFICDVQANDVYCGRRVSKLYGAGRHFACRRCYRLGYAIQRGGPMDRAHHRLARLHRKIGAEYHGPDGPVPPKPKWMRWRTYSRIAKEIEAGGDHLEAVFLAGAQRILARAERHEGTQR
jgi:hypothetical protein